MIHSKSPYMNEESEGLLSQPILNLGVSHPVPAQALPT